MIGLIDCEALAIHEPFIPNLEIMKLYGFYKKTQLTKLILSPEILTACTSIYLRRNYNSTPIPTKWLIDRKVNWGGFSLTNGVYVPLSKEIENSTPNYRIYNEYIRNSLGGRPKMLDDAEKFFNYSFIRLHNGNSIQSRHIVEGMPLLIYDRDIFQEDNYEEKFAIIRAQNPKIVSFLYEPKIKVKENLDAFIKYELFQRELNSKQIITPLIVDIDLTIANFKSFISQYGSFLRTYQRTKVLLPTFTSYDLEKSMPTMKRFDVLANFVYYAYSQGIIVNLKETRNLPDSNEKILFNLFITYVNSSSVHHKTFYNYCLSKPKKIQAIIKKVYDSDPRLHYLFNVSLTYLLLGGTWYGQFRNSPTSKFYSTKIEA